MSEALCVIKEGWLTKQGGMFRIWHKRWFSLVGKDLCYSKDKNTPEKGRINITSVQAVQKAPEVKKSYAFKLVIPEGRTYFIHADNEEDFVTWMDIIEKVRTGKIESGKLSIEDLVIEKQLFQNNFRTISFIGIKQQIGKQLVMKSYQKSMIKNENEIGFQIENRANLLKAHLQFIVPLRHIIPDGQSISLLFDLMPNGCLFGRLQEEGKFSESRSQLYAAEILLGLEELHGHKILYYSLQSSNVLLDEKGHIKLTDPGFVNDLQPPQFNEYTPPEMYLGDAPSIACDWYGLGILLYEMICGLPPFWDQNPDRLKEAVLSHPLRFPHHVSTKAKAIISKLMERSPNNRLGMGENGVEEIKKDPFFSQLKWEDVISKKIAPEWIINPVVDTVYVTVSDNPLE